MDATTAVPATFTEPDLWYTFLKTFGMLAIVIGVLIAVLFLMKRFSIYGGNLPDKQIIKMIASFNLAPREKVVLLDVGGEKILIGVTAQNINFLSKIEDVSGILEKSPETNMKHQGFSKYLQGAVKKMASGDNREENE